MVDQPGSAWTFPAPDERKPDHLLVGSVALGVAASLRDLQRFADLALTAGCHALRVPYCHAGSFFSAWRSGGPDDGRGTATRVPGMGEPRVSDIQELTHRWLGRLAVVVSVYDLAALADLARLDGIAMLAIPAPAATDPRLVTRVAETGLPALLEVNLLSAAGIEEASDRFSPGQLTLMWGQIGPRASALETVEDLFALVRLRRYGRPVGYVGIGSDPLTIAVAIGFGAVVLDTPLGKTGPAGEAVHFPNLVGRLPSAQEDSIRELLRASDLDVVDELRPSLVAARRIRKGETLTPGMVACKAPFRGLSPALLPLILGHRALYDIEQDEPLTFGLIDL
jgi:hypothetical protein